MNLKFRLLCLCLAVLLLTGCTARPEPVGQPTPTPEAKAVAKEPETTPAPQASPTPSPTAVPTQMPLEQLKAEAFTAKTPQEAAEQIRMALEAYPCYTETYQIGTYADYIAYDERHDSVSLQIGGETGDAILRALAPLTESGKLTRLMLEFDLDEPISALPSGMRELILKRLNSDQDSWLGGCADLAALTICTLELDGPVAYPPALKKLAIEGGDLSLFVLFGTEEAPLLPELNSLTLGIQGEEEMLSLDYTDWDFAAVPNLTELNLWMEPGDDARALYQTVLALPTLKTLNGRAKTAYGPYLGFGVDDALSELRSAVAAFAEGEGTIPGESGLPASITGTVTIDIGDASSTNLANDAYIIWGTEYADPGCFYGIPTPLIWTDEMPESTAWVVYIYEYDEIVGYYGEAEYEDWGYAVETRMLVADLSTGRIWKYTAKRTNPPRTNEDDTYGDYCPLMAVEQIRARIQTDLGPYAGCTSDETADAVDSNLYSVGNCFGTEGLPAVITGPIDVQVGYVSGNYTEEDYITSSWETPEGEPYYGIPYASIYDSSGEEGPAWLALILERDVVTVEYDEDALNTEGYTVETHLVLVEMATGKAWHRLIKSSPPPSNPEETNYGSFYPASALTVVKTLLH